jgi:hypothetical protein
MRKKYLLLLIKLYLINKNILKQRNIWIIKFVYLIAIIILLICFYIYINCSQAIIIITI